MRVFRGKRAFSWQGVVAFAALLCFATAGVVAHTLETADNINISSLHNIEGDFYAFGNDIQIDGTVEGDLFAASSQSVSIRGDIGGSANAAAMNTVTFSGHSVGSARLAGSQVQIYGSSGRSLLAAASDAVMINQGAVIEEDAGIVGNKVHIDGWVKRNVKIDAHTVTISGQIDGILNVKADKITIVPPAVVSGRVIYESELKDNLVIEPGATVTGETTWKEPEKKAESEGDVLADVSFKIACLFASFIFGIVVTAFFRPYADESFKQLRARTTSSFAAGLVGLLALGFALVVLLLSLLLATIAMVLLSSDAFMVGAFILIFSILMLPISSFATVVGGIIFYSAVILIGYWVGHIIRGMFGNAPIRLGAGTLLLGLAVLTLLFWLPYYVGVLLWIVVSILGAGAIILGIKNCRREAVALRQLAGASEDKASQDSE